MKKTKEQKGITLIALIITIIVLLILAVVTINAIKGDGIIQYAQNARDDYQRAQDNETEIIDSYLSQLNTATDTKEEEESNAGITTQEAVTQGLKVGDYVSYPVEYTNVGTNVSPIGEGASHYPQDDYIGWRVLSIEGTGSDTYLRLVSAGVPLNYYIPCNGGTGATIFWPIEFFSTPINSTLTAYNFYSSGFKDVSGNVITSIDVLKTLFTNKYTQIDGTTPQVKSITLDDVSSNDNLRVVPCKDGDLSAITWLATLDEYTSEYLYYVYNGGITCDLGGSDQPYGRVFGVRPAVSLKSDIKILKNETTGVWELK